MRILLSFFLCLLWTVASLAQDRVSNVRVAVIDASQLEIRYDLLTVRPGDSVFLVVESRQKGELNILPEFIRGDVGKRLTAGSNRRIVWEAVANGYVLNDDIRATVLVKSGPPMTSFLPSTTPVESVTKSAGTEPAVAAKPTEPVSVTPDGNPATPSTDSVPTRSTRYAGPAWALLSAIAPGIGNIFVQTPKPKIGFRTLLTAGTYGLVAYGLLERQKAQEDYAVYEQQKNVAAGEPYYETANSHHHAYFLATRGAMLVAAVDVVLTFMRGIRNARTQNGTRRVQAVTWRPGLQAGQPTAVVQYTF